MVESRIIHTQMLSALIVRYRYQITISDDDNDDDDDDTDDDDAADDDDDDDD